MRKLYAAAIIMGLLLGVAFAQTPRQAPPDPMETTSANLNRDWIASGFAAEHMQSALAAYVVQVDALKAREASARDSEARLKWVLDNWLPRPAPAAPVAVEPKP